MLKVSVIIPNYNHAPFLKARIDSVLQQTYTDFEVIILDDKSSDNSKEIIESYRGHEKISHIIYNEENSGSTFKQWIKGIELARGNWIWIAESDDVAHDDFLSAALSFTSNEDIGIIYCNSLIIDEKSQESVLYGFSNMPSKEVYSEFATSFVVKSSDFLTQWMLRDNFIPNASAVIFSKQIVNQLNPKVFTEITRMKLMGDWLFWLEILSKSKQICYIDRTLNLFRHHSNNVRENRAKERILEMQIIANYFKCNKNIRDAILDGMIFRYLHKSSGIGLRKKDHLFILAKVVKSNSLLKFIKSKFKKNK